MFEQNAVHIQNMDKYYDQFRALKGIDLEGSKAEKTVVCGTSGLGKSTLIRCINKLEEFHSGSINVLGTELDDNLDNIDEIRRKTGMVFQHFNFFPHITMLENCILAPTLMRKQNFSAAEPAAMEYLTKVKIPEQSDKNPDQLYGGQQQHVVIARALCIKPEIMPFDEPTSVLDPEMNSEVLDAMVKLAEEGMTMICVTHELDIARQVADRVIFIDTGEVVEEAEPNRFFDAPEHECTIALMS